MAKEISLTQGRVAIVDDEDYEFLMHWRWIYHDSGFGGYAMRSVYCGRIDGKTINKTIRMHRVIMLAPDELVVDHINMNGLDNRRCNLRVCTKLENGFNKVKKIGTSKYKGVWLIAKNGKWVAEIHKKKKKYHLGCFDTQEQAAVAYNNAAKKLHGEFARLNEIAA